MMWNRRQFIGGLTAGAAGAWLAAQSVPMAFAQGMMDGAPKRFVFVIEGNCIEAPIFAAPALKTALGVAADERFYFRKYVENTPRVITPDGSAETNLASAYGLGALGAANGAPSLVEQSATVFGLSNVITGGSHSTNCGALSCTRSSESNPGGQTIDAFLSNLPQVRRGAPFDAIRLGVTGSNKQLTYTPSAFGIGRPAPILNDPLAAYYELFGAVLEGEGGRRFRNRSRLLSFALDDVGATLAQYGGADAQKLEAYHQSISTLNQRQALLSDEFTAAMRAVLPSQPVPSADPLVTLEQQFDLATSALRSGLTNVVVLASGTGNGSHFNLQYRQQHLPELRQIAGYSDADGMSRHDLHHESPENRNRVDVIHAASRFHVNQVAKMARSLQGQPDVDGNTMLDNTVIIYMSDNGEQHHSTARDWPMLLVGGQNMDLNLGGRSIVYPGVGVLDANGRKANRQVSNFFNTLTYAAGANVDDFGGEGAEGDGQRNKAGPLEELLTRGA